jgi:AcrR family transcriptional regulator
METMKTNVAQRRPAAPRGARGRPAAAGQAAEAPVAAAPNTTDLIVEAASHLFATRGYANSVLGDVAAAAGFSKGAVYHYFKDKESLLLEVLERIERRSIDATALRVDAHPGPAAEKLTTFVKVQTRWAADYPEDLAILMLMSAETAHTSPRVRERMQSVYDKVAAALARIIEEGKRSGEFSTTQETRDTVLYLQAVHDGNMMVWYRSGTDPKIGRRIAKVTLTGFLKAVRD